MTQRSKRISPSSKTTSSPVSRLKRAWQALTAPPVQERIFLVMYAVAALGGLWILTDPPRTIEGAWGAAITALWGSLLLYGGVIGSLTVRSTYQIIERTALTALTAFLGMYGIFQVSMHFTTDGSRSAGTVAVFFGIIAIALRWSEIWRWDYTPPVREPV